MLGGINNGLFLQSFGGFAGLAILILVLKWGFSSNRKMIITPIKAGKKDQYGLLKPLPIPTTPWHSISVDFITDLPDTHKGMNSIMVVVDRLTKMTHFIPTTKDVRAEGVAHLFKREIFRLHGAPQDIVSDRDPKFVSNFWKEFTQIVGAQRNLSTSFHPRTDGQTERMNRFLEDVLRHYVAPHQ